MLSYIPDYGRCPTISLPPHPAYARPILRCLLYGRRTLPPLLHPFIPLSPCSLARLHVKSTIPAPFYLYATPDSPNAT
jgi:hypothetical protein